jgi:NADPH2:quinone reductase
VRVPDNIPDDIAGTLLDGLVVSHLLALRPIEAGARVLVTGAGRGPGAILTQWARHLGANVFAAVGSVAQIDRALRNGALEVLLRPDQLAARLQRLTRGAGVTVAFDFDGSDAMRSHLAGIVTRADCVRCNEPGEPRTRDPVSLAFSRAELCHEATAAQYLPANAQRLFAAVSSGSVRIPVDHSYPLRKANEAHAHRETHSAPGSTVLRP